MKATTNTFHFDERMSVTKLQSLQDNVTAQVQVKFNLFVIILLEWTKKYVICITSASF